MQLKSLLLFLFSMAWFACAHAQTPSPITFNGTSYTFCADENANCTWSGGGNKFVVFGDVPPDDSTQQLILSSSAVPSGGGCFVGGIAGFNSDPAPGFDKHCWAATGSAPPAPTATLTASPTSVASGGASTLTLSSTNATSCTGPVSGTSGTAVVHPTTTTTYSETCTGTTSPPATATATVTVTGSPPTATLTASPTSIVVGGSSTLTLASTNATSCTGPVSGTSGTATVSPTVTTTYSETCSGTVSPPATATATVTVTSAPPPPTVTLGASPNPIAAGSSTTLTWSSTNATSCSGVGTGLSGSLVVSPATTTTYTETCSGTTSPPASQSVTVTVNGGGMCTTQNTTSGGTANGTITADAIDPNALRVFGNGQAFNIRFVTNVGSADTVNWNIKDTYGNPISSGTFPVGAGTNTTLLGCATTISGYFALSATTNGHGGVLPNEGVRPSGITTFGVLPPTNVVPPVTFASLDQKRIGMQGFNSNFPGLQALGASNVLDDDSQFTLDPTCTGRYTPSLSHLNPFFQTNPSITRIARMDGIPGCNSQSGMFNDSYSLPVNTTQWAAVMTSMAQEQEIFRQNNYPHQTKNYYQVTWEPSLQWVYPSADFVTLYQKGYAAVHAGDPNAFVTGVANPFPNNNNQATGDWLAQYQASGFCNYIDGVTTHGYYNAPTVPSNPPELQDGNADAPTAANALDHAMQGLRSKMQACKANMRLFETEVGISYDVGVGFTPSQNQLFAHAAVGARTHLIILGEGAQRTYYFFSTDIAGGELPGYGTFFDLTESGGGFDQTSLSPKPEAMALATLSRVLEGTQTLGGYTLASCVDTAGCTHAYAFQQLNSGAVISALWFHKNSAWTGPSSYSQTVSTSYTLKVDAAGTSGTVNVIDWMGNVVCHTYANGQLTLTLTEAPQYVVSANSTVTKSLVTVPVGYTGQ